MNGARRRATKEELTAHARMAAFLRGCTCTPNITIREISPGVHYARIEHDAWCSHPSQRRGMDA